MKKIALLFLACAALCGCEQHGYFSFSGELHDDLPDPSAARTSEVEEAGAFESEDRFPGECSILLGDAITVIGGGALVEENRISITEGGVYSISGSIERGMISVDCAEPVKLILNGASVRSEGSAISGEPEKLIIECAVNSRNFLSGGGRRAALYGGKKLIVCGKGSLEIDGGSAPAIETKGKLKLACRSVTAKSGAQALCAESVETEEGTEVVIEEE